MDPYGLWGTIIHLHGTAKWARDVGYTSSAARAIGAADEAVDSISGGESPFPAIGDQSYHFNRNINGGTDTRMIHHLHHFERAQIACLPAMDNPKTAVQELGLALHHLQDIVAHGDFGMKESVIFTHHNSKSPQTDLLGSYGKPGYYPDNEDLDTVGPIRYITKLVVGASPYIPATNVTYDYYIYVPGKNRYNLTRMDTIEALKEYYWFVHTRGGCKCKKYFLGEEQNVE